MTKHQPHAVDLHVGRRLRLRRKMEKLSQAKLAAELGLTFQQLQKYERGTNRISASKLYLAAKALRAPLEWFFEGLPATTAARTDRSAENRADQVRDFLAGPEGLELAVSFPRLPKSARPRILALIAGLAHDAVNDLEAAPPLKAVKAAHG